MLETAVLETAVLETAVLETAVLETAVLETAALETAALETAALDEADLAEYCRKRGVFAAQIKAWRGACEQANDWARIGIGASTATLS